MIYIFYINPKETRANIFYSVSCMKYHDIIRMFWRGTIRQFVH